jgi:ATP-dependent Clp protease ATP-binding subunit ClpC
MFERFTDRARKTMALAHQCANECHREKIDTEHLVLGLLKEGNGVGAKVLKGLGVTFEGAQAEVYRLVGCGPDTVTTERLSQTPQSKKVIEYAINEARSFNQNWIGTEHLLLGLIHDQQTVAAQVLVNLGLKPEEVRKAVLAGFPTDPSPT